MIDQAPGHSPEVVQQLFDAKAAGWSAKYRPDGRLAGRLAQLADAAARHAGAGDYLLDLGCGTGELARHLAAAGLHVTGCDISANMLERAAAADPASQARWIQLDPRWQRLPFEAASFDTVVAASVLEYVPSPGAVLRECARVLRPGGVMVCTVPDVRHPVRWLEWVAAGVARAPAVRAAECWPRLNRYLTYLRISRNRRSVGWWQAAAAGAGLLPLSRREGAAERSPLRLLVLQRPGGAGDVS